MRVNAELHARVQNINNQSFFGYPPTKDVKEVSESPL
jgi:hypothetical protein